MLTFFFAPGACSMASHIALEESGARYEARPVNLAKGEQRTPEYLAVNPRGKVPALRTGNEVLTENLAIIAYLAKTYPGARLLPTVPLAEAQALSLMAWLSNSVHPNFTRINRPERFAKDSAAFPTLKESGREGFWAALQEIDGLLTGKPFLCGSAFTGVDGYALVFYGWGLRIDLPLHELRNYTALKDRLLERPAVRRVLEREGSVILERSKAA